MWNDFVARLVHQQQMHNTDLALLLNPRMNRLPLPIQRYDDPFFPFGRELIDATRDILCAYVFDLASYLSIGAAGAVALERTIRYAAQDTLCILHGPFANRNYTAMADATGFGIDALTVSDERLLDTYLNGPPYAAFVIQDDAVDYKKLPDRGGYFWIASNSLAHRGPNNSTLLVRLAVDTVVYAGRGDDYADHTRQTLESMQ